MKAFMMLISNFKYKMFSFAEAVILESELDQDMRHASQSFI